jgi:hypothetical protein
MGEKEERRKEGQPLLCKKGRKWDAASRQSKGTSIERAHPKDGLTDGLIPLPFSLLLHCNNLSPSLTWNIVETPWQMNEWPRT